MSAWFYIDAVSKDEARAKAEADDYTVRRVSTVGRLSAGLTRFKVFVTAGRGV